MNIPIVHHTPPNPHAARENRQVFDSLGITCINVIGGPGAGKTSVLEAILPRVGEELRVGILESDLRAPSDAQRLGALGFPVVQVLTDGQCHLGANQLQRGMEELPLRELDLLVVENIGNVVCPSRVWLGEHIKMVVLSISAGHEVIHKYPELVQDAELILLTKYDLLNSVDFELGETIHALRRLSPAAEIICVDTRRRVGIDRAAGWLLGYVRAQRMRRVRRARPRQRLEHATTPG